MNGKISYVLVELILLKWPITIQKDLQIQGNPFENSRILSIFHRNRGEESKIHMEPQRIPNNQSNLEHKRTKLKTSHVLIFKYFTKLQESKQYDICIKSRPIGHWNKIEGPEIKPCVCG